MIGLEKIVSPASSERRFNNWGYPDNFFYLVGIFEIALVFLLLIPRYLKYGLSGTIALMTGATITHLLPNYPHDWAMKQAGW